jgi:hypothetical protein
LTIPYGKQGLEQAKEIYGQAFGIRENRTVVVTHPLSLGGSYAIIIIADGTIEP